MFKRSRNQDVSQSRGRLLRCVLFGLAIAGGLWSVSVSVDRLKEGGAKLRSIGWRIFANEEFKGEVLTRVLGTVESAKGSSCRLADQGQAVTMVAYGIAKAAIKSDDEANALEQLKVVESQARVALACSPYRGTLWFLLFWARTQQTGFQTADLPFLWMSYRFAPHEGWLQTIRSPFVMQLFEELPPEGKQLALMEFGELVESERASRTAAIFSKLSHSVRESVLPVIERVSLSKRQEFGSALQKLGIDVQIDGVRDPNRERWERYISAVDKVRDVLKETRKAPERAVPESQ